MARIYTASKRKHAHKWRMLRDAGHPIFSTWIDEGEPGQTKDFTDARWRRFDEVLRSHVVLLYVEEGDVLNRAYAEAMHALAYGIPVYYVGPPGLFSMVNDPGVRCFDTINGALAALAAQPAATV